ncbi:GAF domain-containing protein [Kribbella amoyensis]|uniref:GAF domain-containing protein n=1 Tax=Kribbella amoyensis TaxID=996641 RepID=A0A561BU94_9ACTN|nr:GAF and ANTAR domain-containing protein [Kribbella amoyensis]TWD82456.1 GAF domain-containing protein [Kribbella amoyensis]
MTDQLDPTGTADRFAELAMELHASEGVEETIETVLSFALDAIGCTHAGCVLQERGRLEVAAVTDPVIERIYTAQLERGEGPLITAQDERRTLWIRDTALETRWPEWSAQISAEGLRTVMQLPLMIAGRAVGVLTLYSTEVDAFDDDDEAVAQILARHAAVATATARQEQTLVEAVDARKLIGQAMGILMERFAVDGDQAFAILRRYSQDNNVKLRVVADDLVRTRRLPV